MKVPLPVFSCIIFFFVCISTGTGFDYPADYRWKLVWSDEFNGANIDPANWGFDLARGPNNDGFGSWSLEYFTDRPENAFISNGYLVIRALNDRMEGQYISSAQVTTKDKRSFLYGRIESRMKLPRGYGMWPGFCMFGTNIDIVGWPECGEIDVMEMRGGDYGDSNRTVMGTLHFRNGSKAESYPDKWTYETKSFILPGNEDFSADFHVFGIVWDREKIVFTVDGVPYYTNWTRSYTKTEFRLPFYLYFNIKIGGEYYGHAIRSLQDVTASLPQTMMIDWVRYYQ